jgi:hypothetical protein
MKARSILFGALALVAGSLLATSASAGWWRHHHWGHHHWDYRHVHFWPAPTVAPAAYVWWDHPYYYYSPYSVRRGVLVHEGLSIGPVPRGGVVYY